MSPTKMRLACRSVMPAPNHVRIIILLVSLISLYWLTTSLSSINPASADTVEFAQEFRGTGRYGYVAQGIGTRGNPDTGEWTGAGDVTLAIPDTATIVMARLIWTGRSNAYDADGVTVAMDGGPATAVQATEQIEQDPWCCNAQQRRESADITDLGIVQPGTHTYTIADHEHATSPIGNFLNYGVGLWVIYEDVSEEWGETVVYGGQDSFFRLWQPPVGPHTQVRCVDFQPSQTDRVVQMTHLVSGVDTEVDIRSMAFWYQTGSGDKPGPAELPGLINQPGAVGYETDGQYPFQSYAGLEWDNFEPEGGIPVNAGDTWACFQIESGDSQNLAGLDNVGLPASGMWGLFMIKLPVEEPTAVTLTDFSVQSVWGRDVTLRWETASEQDHFGFNLFRAAAADFAAAEQVHFEPAAVPGGATTGAVYAVTDTVPAAGDYWYWLESVDTSGGTELAGPVDAAVSGRYRLLLPLIQR